MSFTEEQLAAINHEEGDIIVSASAGSGKTSVMIERVIRLVTQKRIPVDRVAVLTFTDAAAAEMKSKLKDALKKKIAENQGDDFLASQLSVVSVADISTIHSFCSRLLRTYFFEVGIAPDYKILEEKTVLPMKERAMDGALSDLLLKGDENFRKVLKRHTQKRKLSGF